MLKRSVDLYRGQGEEVFTGVDTLLDMCSGNAKGELWWERLRAENVGAIDEFVKRLLDVLEYKETAPVDGLKMRVSRINVVCVYAGEKEVKQEGYAPPWGYPDDEGE